MPALPRVPKNRAATPGSPAMPSPTIATIQQSRVRSTRWIWPCAISPAKASSTTCRVRSANELGTAKQMECSELACEIRITDTPAFLRAPNNLSAVPGTPIMPVPSRFTSATFSTDVTPLIARPECGASSIIEPGAAGSNVLRMTIGIPLATAGDIV